MFPKTFQRVTSLAVAITNANLSQSGCKMLKVIPYILQTKTKPKSFWQSVVSITFQDNRLLPLFKVSLQILWVIVSLPSSVLPYFTYPYGCEGHKHIGERQLKPKRSHFYASEVGNDDNRADIIFLLSYFFHIC